MERRTEVFLNRIETSVPAHDVHARFLAIIPEFFSSEKERRLFSRLASKCQIEHRYSVLKPSDHESSFDTDGLYTRGRFAGTGKRMEKYQRSALELAAPAVEKALRRIPRDEITHLIISTCTGFYAPGLDIEIQKKFNLRSDLDRSVIGFMGCYAAFNAMKSAFHIVRSQPSAQVLIVNLEICTLHMRESGDLETALGFLQFADGCAASLISSSPFGLKLESFKSQVAAESENLIRWGIGDNGFEMKLSLELPSRIGRVLPELMASILPTDQSESIRHWAIHPGGRSILDVVQEKLRIRDEQMEPSRAVLRDFGNMSSATIMFILKSILESGSEGAGLAMGFGPGLTVESMLFRKTPH